MVAQQAPLCNAGIPCVARSTPGLTVHPPELGVQSPACPLCTLTPFQPPQSGDIDLCPSWGILAQLCASSWGSVTRAWGSISRSDIPQPEQTPRGNSDHMSRRSMTCRGTRREQCASPHFYLGHSGEARLGAGGVSFSSVQSMYWGRRGQVSRAGEMDVPWPPRI